jgi:hypothetical protein
MHQRQQRAQFSRRETLARKPRQVVARQVGNDSPLVLAKGHGAGHQQLQGFRFHWRGSLWRVKRGRYCNLHDDPSGDHAERTSARFLSFVSADFYRFF